MKRQLVFLALAVVLTFTLIVPVQAKEDRKTQPPPQTMGVATLVNDLTGESFDLPVVITRQQQIGPDSYETEYQVEIPQAILLGSKEVTISGLDPTRGAKISILQNFSQKFVDTEYVAVFYHKGRWERLDSTVSCTQLKVTSQCNGEFETGGLCQKTESKVWTNPTIGTWYQQTPSWAGKYVTVNELGHFQAGKTTATLKRGVTTWTFEVRILNQGQW